MSEENVEKLRSAYEAFLKGDLESIFAVLDPRIRVSDHDRVLDTPREYRGPDGVMQMAAEAAEAFEDHRYEAEDFAAVGNDQVIVTARRRGRGIQSGIEVDERQWHLWQFRDGKATRLRTFVDEGDALEAAGLSE